MSAFYTNLRDNTAFRLLSRYGDVFRITKSGPPSYNPETGVVTASTTTQDVVGKAFSIDQKFDAGEMVETSKVEIFLTASDVDFEPTQGMSIKTPTDSTAPLQITNVQRIPESGTVVMYRLIAVR